MATAPGTTQRIQQMYGQQRQGVPPIPAPPPGGYPGLGAARTAMQGALGGMVPPAPPRPAPLTPGQQQIGTQVRNRATAPRPPAPVPPAMPTGIPPSPSGVMQGPSPEQIAQLLQLVRMGGMSPGWNLRVAGQPLPPPTPMPVPVMPPRRGY